MSPQPGSAGARAATRLQEVAAALEPRLAAALEGAGDVPQELDRALRHALLGGGKRLRPALVQGCCRLVGGADEAAWPGSIAVEMVHAYSLVHDDLPCMDDDDLRRGRPTVHKEFGEAMAVLVGDALQALAFQVLLGGDGPEPARARAAAVLARAAGAAGMVGGQVLDVAAAVGAAGEEPPRLERVARIHRKKTAALLAASAEIGAILGGAPGPIRASVRAFGRKLGLAFQIVDDCLDETASARELGKTAGKDRPAGKLTWPACVGVERSLEEAGRLAEAASCELAAVKGVEMEARFLEDLASFVVDRRL